MIPIESGGNELAKAPAGEIARAGAPLTVGALERALLGRFPREDAEEWDRTGLLVGDPSALVTGVAVALDVTREAIVLAQRMGANVLLTHHPAFLSAPGVLSPSYAVATAPGVNAYEAISRGVALLNFHTALDVSREAARLLAGLLSLDFQRILMPLSSDEGKGYGQLCSVREDEGALMLSHLGARCMAVFGRPPRLWGDMDRRLERIAIANGSAGDVVGASLAAHADCLVAGEVKYHAALDAVQAGLSIVELGHDVSELPLAAVLAQAAIDAGVPSDAVTLLDQGSNWTTPESTRV